MKFLSRVFTALNLLPSLMHRCERKSKVPGRMGPIYETASFSNVFRRSHIHLGWEYSLRCVQTFASELSVLHPPEPQGWAAMARKLLIALGRYLEARTLAANKTHLKEKLAKLASELQRLNLTRVMNVIGVQPLLTLVRA
jgi:hypothetical protein